MIEELWPGGPHFRDEPGVFPIGMDSVLLADFAKRTGVRKITRAIDLGCGSGIISILLAFDDKQLSIDGLEIQPQAARLAVENVKSSGLSEQIDIIEGDLRRCCEYIRPGIYDLTVSNPPYYEYGGGKRPKCGASSIARVDELCTLDDLCKAAGYLTRWGGSFAIAQKPDRLTAAFSAVSRYGFEPKRARFVHHTHASPPSLVLIESRRGAKPSLKIEAPLILKNGDGSDSDEIERIYRVRG